MGFKDKTKRFWQKHSSAVIGGAGAAGKTVYDVINSTQPITYEVLNDNGGSPGTVNYTASNYRAPGEYLNTQFATNCLGTLICGLGGKKWQKVAGVGSMITGFLNDLITPTPDSLNHLISSDNAINLWEKIPDYKIKLIVQFAIIIFQAAVLYTIFKPYFEATKKTLEILSKNLSQPGP